MIRTFNVKVPFIGFDVMEVDIDDENFSDEEKENILDEAEEKVKDMVYETLNGRKAERFEFFKYVEGTNCSGFSDQRFQGFVEETTPIEEEENE